MANPGSITVANAPVSYGAFATVIELRSAK